MELHQLRYLVAVAENRSFSLAAERCHVAQPSLSQQIRKLEGELKQPLFDRLPRSVVLTEAGKRLLVFARKILTDLADAQRSVEECTGSVAGHLVIGAIPTIAPYVLPRLIARFQESYALVTLEIVEDVTENLVRGLNEGELDVGLVSSCRGGSNLEREAVGKEELFAALPVGHRLAGRDRISWKDLKRERLLLLHEAHCLSNQVERLFAAHSIRPEVVFRGAQLPTVVGMVAAGLGVSLVPRMMIGQTHETGCVFRTVAGAVPERELNLIRSSQRYRTKAVAAFEAQAARELLAAAGAESRTAPGGTVTECEVGGPARPGRSS